MNRTIYLIAALLAVALEREPKALANAPSYFVTDSRAPKGTRPHPYTVEELVALTTPPSQAWVYGKIKTVAPSIASDPLDIDVTFSNGLKTRVSLAKYSPALGFGLGKLAVFSTTSGIQVADATRPTSSVFRIQAGGEILVGLNITKKRSILTGIVGHYQDSSMLPNNLNGPLGIPK